MKAVTVTARGAHRFLRRQKNQLTDGGEVSSVTIRPTLSPPGRSWVLISRPQDRSGAVKIRSIEKHSNQLL
jgi:hypothetical protein